MDRGVDVCEGCGVGGVRRRGKGGWGEKGGGGKGRGEGRGDGEGRGEEWGEKG